MKTIMRSLVFMTFISSLALGQTLNMTPPAASGGGGDKHFVLGLDAAVLAGMAKYHSNGNVKSAFGLSPGLGIGFKKYFGDGASPGNFKMYWNIGTDALVLPFIGVGGDYIFDMEHKLYLGANITSRLVLLLIPIPSLNIGIYL